MHKFNIFLIEFLTIIDDKVKQKQNNILILRQLKLFSGKKKSEFEVLVMSS